MSTSTSAQLVSLAKLIKGGMQRKRHAPFQILLEQGCHGVTSSACCFYCLWCVGGLREQACVC